MLSNNPTDQVLVQNFLNGDSIAFEKLLLRHKNRVYAFIISKVKDPALAEDIFQETFLKVIQTLKNMYILEM